MPVGNVRVSLAAVEEQWTIKCLLEAGPVPGLGCFGDLILDRMPPGSAVGLCWASQGDAPLEMRNGL